MGVLQPLYFTAGKYTADLDRTMLAALIDPESNKSRAGGVLPPKTSMQVSVSGTSATVATGMCVIADTSTPGPDSYGLYLAGVDTGTVSLNFSTLGLSAGTYLIYAEVNESAFRVTTKQITSNVATLTYSETAQKFAVGQTIAVSGVDDTFDGVYPVKSVGGSGTAWTVSYDRTAADTAALSVTAVAIYGGAEHVITDADISSNTATIITSGAGIGAAPQDLVTIKGVGTSFDGTYQIATISGTTFTYKKITANASNALAAGGLASSVARVSAPFNIKAVLSSTGTGSATAIPLATVQWSGSGFPVSPVDKRTFVAAAGGVHHWDSTIGTKSDITTASGKLLFDAKSTTAQTLEIYDGVSAAWKTLYKTNDWSHVLDPTLTSSVYAAPANHDHAGVFAPKLAAPTATSSAGNTVVAYNATTYPTTLLTRTITVNKPTTLLISYRSALALNGFTPGSNTAGIFVALDVSGAGLALTPTDDDGKTSTLAYAGTGVFTVAGTFMVTTTTSGSVTVVLKAVKRSNNGTVNSINDYLLVAALHSTDYTAVP